MVAPKYKKNITKSKCLVKLGLSRHIKEFDNND